MRASSRGRKELVDLLFRTQQEQWELILIYYTVSGPQRLSCQLSTFNRAAKSLTIVPDKNTTFRATELVSGSGLVDFYLVQGPVIFRSQIFRFNYDGTLEVAFPEHYIFHERRMAQRVEIEQSPIVALNFADKTLIKTCFDLGLGGFSVIFSISEKRNFSPKMELVQNTLTHRGKKIFFDCTVIYELRPKPFFYEKFPYAFSRVSFRFNRLSAVDQQILEEIISTPLR